MELHAVESTEPFKSLQTVSTFAEDPLYDVVLLNVLDCFREVSHAVSFSSILTQAS